MTPNNSNSYSAGNRAGSVQWESLREALLSLYNTLRSEEGTASYAACSLCVQLCIDLVDLEEIEERGQLPPLSKPIQFDLSMLPAG